VAAKLHRNVTYKDVVDSIDVHELMNEIFFIFQEAVGHCVRTDSRLKQLFMYDETGFYNVSGYYILILKLPVVPQMPKSWGGGTKFFFCSLRSHAGGTPPTFKNVAPPLDSYYK